MPKPHQEYAKWTPQRIISWARQNGEATAALAEKIIASRNHPVQGFRSCMGIIRLAKSFGNERVEKACHRALSIGSCSYKSVDSILRNNLDQQPISVYQQNDVTATNHEYVRGKNYFH
jgi:transposase